LAGSTTKKVLIRRFDRESVAGYVNPQTYLRPAGVELVTPDGSLAMVPYHDLKAVHFVKDFDAGAAPSERKVFNTRPKMDGLWVRMRFRDQEIMEGILSNNLLTLDAYGFAVTPPDPFSNNQRVFVPRAALADIQVLGVVGSPLKKAAPKAKPVPVEQGKLFES